MNLHNNDKLRFTEYWIASKEHKKFRRLYFTTNKIFVIKAPTDRIKMYLAVGIVVLFLLLSAFINQNVIVSGFLFGFLLGSICGSIIIGLIGIVIITILVWSFDNKLKNLSPSESLNLNKNNYSINYSDISNIELNPLPRTFFRKEGELLIETTYGTHKLIISDVYFEEIEDKIKEIRDYIPEETNNRKKLKLKSP